jgi:hypothetical protein
MHKDQSTDRGEGSELRAAWKRVKLVPVSRAHRGEAQRSPPFLPTNALIPHEDHELLDLASPQFIRSASAHHRALSSPPYYRAQLPPPLSTSPLPVSYTYSASPLSPSSPSLLSAPPSPNDRLPSCRTVTEWAFRGRDIDRRLPPTQRGNPPSLFGPLGPSSQRLPTSDDMLPSTDHDASAEQAARVFRHADAVLLERLHLYQMDNFS